MTRSPLRYLLPPALGIVAGLALATSLAAAPGAAAPAAGEPVALSAPPPSPAAVTAPEGMPALAPKPYQQEVVDLVARHLLETHYAKQAIDDALSALWFDAYLDALDPQRVIFRASDIAEFEPYRTQFDDLLRRRPAPDLGPPMLVYDRYRRRFAEYAAASAEIAAGPLDLQNDEVWVTRDRRHGERAHVVRPGWPVTEAEARELWRQQVEEDFLEDLLVGRDPEEKIRERVVKRHRMAPATLAQLEVNDVLQLWLDALGGLYDPHTTWMPPADSENFQVDITNSVVGIGASLGKEDEYVVVKDVLPGGPAERDGRIKKEDRILSVAQGDDDPVDAMNLRLDKVVSMIRGKIKTDVVLEIEHATGEKEAIRLTRERVEVEAGKASSNLEISPAGRHYGYVKLPQFYLAPPNNQGSHGASDDVALQIRELQAQQPLDGVILDLRQNGGGSLREAVEVAGLFLPGGAVVQVRDRAGRVEVLHDENKDVVWGGPLVVLTDATSASASEIVAGALQDYGRALVVGDAQTHGKGTVQELVELTDSLRGRYPTPVGGELKYTIQKFYRITGASTQREGVHADVVLPSWWEGWDVFERDLDHALPYDEIPPAVFMRQGDAAAAKAELQARSDARRAKSEDFERLVRLGEDQERRSNEASISLSLPVRIAERDARKQLQFPDFPEGLDREARKKELRDRDFPLDEGLAIFDDWLAVAPR